VRENGKGFPGRKRWIAIADKLKYYKKEYGPIFHRGRLERFPAGVNGLGAGVADWGIHSKNGIDEPERWVMGSDGRGDRQDGK